MPSTDLEDERFPPSIPNCLYKLRIDWQSLRPGRAWHDVLAGAGWLEPQRTGETQREFAVPAVHCATPSGTHRPPWVCVAPSG